MCQLNQLESLKSRLSWNQRRLQQFADRAGLSLIQVTILMQDQARAPSLDRQIDLMVDPDLRTNNQPIFKQIKL